MTKQVALAMLVLAVGLALGGEAEPEPVLTGFDVPEVAIPYLTQRPTTDGAVNDDEWRAATSFRLLRTTRGAVSARQTRYWLGWDERNLYLAMRSPLRKGERPVQGHRGEAGDPFVVADDSYEFYFDVGGALAGGLPAYVQYIGNFAGCKYDAAHLPTVGIRRMSYEAGWQPHSRIAETPGGRAWEMEVVIPGESILMKQPFTEGFVVRALLARNYKRPWEQNSIEGASIFRNTATYSRLRLVKAAPAIHVLGAADPRGNTIGLKLALYGREDTQVKWTFASDSGLRKEGLLAVRKGETAAAPCGLGLEQLDKGKKRPRGGFRIQVCSPDGKTIWLDWGATRAIARPELVTQTFDDDRGDQALLSLVLNPVRDYLRVTGDFINYDTRDQIDVCRVVVSDAKGQELAQKDCRINERAFVRDVVWLRGLRPGEYVAVMTCLNREGNAVLTRETRFAKKDHAKEFPWWNTPHGSIEKVIPPWTPVTYDKGAFGLWGRSMTVGQAGLPKEIQCQGRAVLARGCTLTAELPDGSMVSASRPKLAVESQARHRTVVIADSSLKTLAIRSRVCVEFDGMYKVELTLTPKEPLAVRALRLTVPLKPEFTEHLHACGEGIRWGYASQYLPREGKGRLWDCRAVDGQRMAAGSFIPYVWVGNSYGGLCWYADSDKGWVPDDDTPAMVVQRERADSTDLVLNLISSEFTIDRPRTIVFAFQATPIKPLFPGWRTAVYDFRDSFQEWQCAEKVGSNRMRSPVPWTFDVEKCRKMVERWHAGSRILSKYRRPAIPYGRHNEVFPRNMPEAGYFAEHWQSKGSWHIHYTKSLTDYWVDKLAGWIESCDIDGYYSDNTHPAVCTNVEAGRGYYLPDGRIQPAYNIFGIRRYFLRLRAVFAEHGKQNWIVTHMTHNMVLPWLGACDIALDGEDHHVAPEQNRTYLDAWPLERLRVGVPRQLGVSVTFKPEFVDAPRWQGGRYTYGQVFRSYAAAMLLHDLVPMGGWRIPTTWFLARDRFGIGADDVRFLGYWEQGSGIRSENPEVLVSAWQRPGRLLLAVVGMQKRPGKTSGVVRIDWRKLGLPAPQEWYVYDAERLATYAYVAPATGKPVNILEPYAPNLTLHPDGSLTIEVTRHDYRQLIIQHKSQPVLDPARR